MFLKKLTYVKLITKTHLIAQFLYYLDCDGLYIPQKTLNTISRCLVGKSFKLDSQYDMKKLSVEGYFTDNFYFEVDAEMIVVGVDLKIQYVDITLNGEVYYGFDEDEILALNELVTNIDE
jgi:hypothetical protein